jgi:hypothetical protein
VLIEYTFNIASKMMNVLIPKCAVVKVAKRLLKKSWSGGQTLAYMVINVKRLRFSFTFLKINFATF